MAIICEKCAETGKRSEMELVHPPKPDKEKVKKPGDRFPGEDSREYKTFRIPVYRCKECGHTETDRLLDEVWNQPMFGGARPPICAHVWNHHSGGKTCQKCGAYDPASVGETTWISSSSNMQ